LRDEATELEAQLDEFEIDETTAGQASHERDTREQDAREPVDETAPGDITDHDDHGEQPVPVDQEQTTELRSETAEQPDDEEPEALDKPVTIPVE